LESTILIWCSTEGRERFFFNKLAVVNPPNPAPKIKIRLPSEDNYHRKAAKSWEDVPESVRNTFEKLGIPEAERKFLAGVGAQYESEVVYHNLHEDLAKQGVIFIDTDTAVKEQPELMRKFFGKVIPPDDNKFAALNSVGHSYMFLLMLKLIFRYRLISE
jgi:Fe-S cluster assembly scaffold protein SufB